METSFWRKLEVFSTELADSCVTEFDQLVSAFGTRRDESRKNIWTDNVDVNSHVIWTFNTGLYSKKLHLELSIISTTGKSKLF